MKIREDNSVLNIAELKKLISEECNKTPYDGFLLETPEMLEERQSIRNAMFPFSAIFLFGPAGSGKTFISNKVGIPKYGDSEHGFRTVNPDQRIEDVFPAFGLTMKFAETEADNEKRAAAKAKEKGEPEPPRSDDEDEHVRALERVQQGVRAILQNASQGHTHNLIMKAKPLLFDTTGEDVQKISKRMKELMRLGYKVGVIMVNVPPDVSVSRDDKRDRTVGADRTNDISVKYQDQVVQQKGYFKALQGTGAKIFGNEVYPNLFDLRDNSLLDGITDEHVKAMGNPTPESAKKLLDRITADAADFLKSGEEGLPAHGKTIYNAMKAMVKLTDGQLGQNMGELETIWSETIQEKWPEAANLKLIQDAAKYLAWLGGAEPTARQAQRSKKKTDDDSVRAMTGNDNPVPVGGDLRPDKDGTVRQRQHEQTTIGDIITNAILEIKKGIGE